jgi:hypothetical protein
VNRLALVLLLALATTACATAPGTGPLVLPHGELPVAQPVLSSAVLGDLHTLDPCSLVPPKGLTGPTGVAFRTSPVAELDTCVLVGDRGKAADVVRVGPLTRETVAAGGTDVGKGLVVSLPETRNGSCTVDVQFPDLVDLAVTADSTSTDPDDPADGQQDDGLCDEAAAIARAAARVVLAGGVRHRAAQPGTFAALDVCAAVTPALRTAAHLDDPVQHQYPQGHRCDWTPGQAILVQDRVSLVIATDLGVDFQVPGTTTEVIDGRTTYVDQEPGGGTFPTCVLSTPETAPTDAVHPVVVAELRVTPTQATETPCALGRTDAAVLWTALPH